MTHRPYTNGHHPDVETERRFLISEFEAEKQSTRLDGHSQRLDKHDTQIKSLEHWQAKATEWGARLVLFLGMYGLLGQAPSLGRIIGEVVKAIGSKP